jgi:dihydrofolate reductase
MGDPMTSVDSRVTIHMVASLDGFIARKDGSVDWLETADEFVDGVTMDPGFVEAFLATIDCYVMGSRTYETALRFAERGMGWAYGDKPTFVLTHRELPRIRETVEFYAGDLAQLVNGRLRPSFRSIWFVGGGMLSGECLRLGLADEVCYSIMPIVIGEGIAFFDNLDKDVPLHLAEVKAYRSGMVELRYEVRVHPDARCGARRVAGARATAGARDDRSAARAHALSVGVTRVAARGVATTWRSPARPRRAPDWHGRCCIASHAHQRPSPTQNASSRAVHRRRSGRLRDRHERR